MIISQDFPENKVAKRAVHQDFSQKLAARGIAQAAQALDWHTSGDGWRYPVRNFENVIGTQRWKAYDSHAVPKYRWLPNKPHGFDYYFAPDVKDAILAAGGKLYIAAGEVDVLTYHSAGIRHVLAWFGETSVPKTIAQDLAYLGVNHLIYLPDRDGAGVQSATKLRAALRETSIFVDIRELPTTLGEKADTNDLWQAVGFDAVQFRAIVANAPELALPEAKTAPKRPQNPSQHDFTGVDYQAAMNALFEQMERLLEVQDFKADGWSKPIQCIFHEDSRPSAAWHRDSGVLHCFACGQSYSPREISERLCLSYPEKPQRLRQISQTERIPLAETIQPYELAPFAADLRIQKRYISNINVDDLPRDGAILIKSPIGTGKTELIKRLLKDYESEHGQTPHVLVLTHRQALAENIADRLGMESYKSIESSYLRAVPQLVMVYNSVWKLAQIGWSLPKYDLIVIDEIEQFHQHLGGSTFKAGEAQRAYQILRQLIAETRLVIGLDAHASNISRDWFDTLKERVFTIENTFTFKRGEMHLHSRAETVIQSALNIAQTSSLPVVIPTNSKRTAKELAAFFLGQFRPEQVYMICSENSESYEAQDFIKHINERLPQLKVFIYSPSLGTGVDIQAEVAAVCAVFQSRPLAAPDLQQMLGRCRHAQVTHVYIQAQNQDLESDWHSIYQKHVQNALRTGLECAFNDYQILDVSPVQRSILKLLAQMEAENNRSANDLLSHFVALSSDYIIHYADEHAAPIRQLLETSREALRETEKIAVLKAEAVNFEDYEKHRQNGTLNPEIRAGLERFKMEDTVGLPLDTALYQDLHLPEQREAIRRFADLLDDESALQALDRYQASQETLLNKRKHYTLRRALLLRLISDVWGSLEQACGHAVEGSIIEKRLANFITLHRADLMQLFGWRADQSSKPLAVLRWLLGQIGLKLDSQQIMEHGERFRVYSLACEQWFKQFYYAELHLKQRQLKRAALAVKNGFTQNVVLNRIGDFEESGL